MRTWILNSETKGTGRTLVLIHGVAGSLHIWDPIFDDLAKSHRVFRMDLLGYGHSPKPRTKYTPQLHIDTIRQTLHHNEIKPPYTLVGLSMGVSLALEYASQYPGEVNGFIGIGLPYYKDEDAARVGLHNNTWARLAIEHPILAPFIVQPIWTLGRFNILPAAKFARIYTPLMAHETLLNPYRIFKSNIWNCMVYNPQTQLLKESGNLRRLFIHGDSDEWQDAATVKEALKTYENSEFKIVPDTGHNVVVLKPEIATALILEYLG
jgi:pimeloyl-ACP methyl ester carboxylesterase